MIQFMKGWSNYGELTTAEKYLPHMTIEQFGLETFVDKANPTPGDIELAQKGVERAKTVLLGGSYQLIILDEINVALDYNLVELDQVMELIDIRPSHVELVLTGRNAHEKIIEAADLVTEINLVKHPYYQGVEAREGIEF